MIVADTGAILALLDVDDPHHRALTALLEEDSDQWVLPWAILPEVDHLARRGMGDATARGFMADVAAGEYVVEALVLADLRRAAALDSAYADLRMGLTDAVVMAMTERLRARAIVTIDLRHFGAVRLQGSPALYPRDLPAA